MLNNKPLFGEFSQHLFIFQFGELSTASVRRDGLIVRSVLIDQMAQTLFNISYLLWSNYASSLFVMIIDSSFWIMYKVY